MDSSAYEIGHINCCKQGSRSKIKNRMANSVDPDETSHPDLRSLQRHLCWCAGMKELSQCVLLENTDRHHLRLLQLFC